MELRVRFAVCNYIKSDGTKCGNKGRCRHHDHLPKQSFRTRLRGFFRQPVITSACGNIIARVVSVTALLVLGVVFQNDPRIQYALNLRSPLSSSVETVASNRAPAPVTDLRASAIDGVPVSSLQENLHHSDDVTAIVTRAAPDTMVGVNGIELNGGLGVTSFSLQGNQSLSDAMAAIEKNVTVTGQLTGLTSPSASFDAPTFDWSKVDQQTQALIDASVIRSSQTGIIQNVNFKWPADTGVITGTTPASMSLPDPYKLANTLSAQTLPWLTGTESAAQLTIIGADGQLKPIIPSGSDGDLGIHTPVPATWQTFQAITGTPPIIATPTAQ
jgi:hypothetical protein